MTLKFLMRGGKKKMISGKKMRGEKSQNVIQATNDFKETFR